MKYIYYIYIYVKNGINIDKRVSRYLNPKLSQCLKYYRRIRERDRESETERERGRERDRDRETERHGGKEGEHYLSLYHSCNYLGMEL